MRNRYGMALLIVLGCMLVAAGAAFLASDGVGTKRDKPPAKQSNANANGGSGGQLPAGTEGDPFGETAAEAPFQPVTAIEAVGQIGVGWNLGNQLDAMPTEGSWNNGIVGESTIEAVRKAGFDLIRIPVTWSDHIGPAPEYKIDAIWMNRVEEVVDWALKRDMWVMLNVHHDSWSYMNLDKQADPEGSVRKLEKVWGQIAGRFSSKSEKLMLETLNEPTDIDPGKLNDLNDRIASIIRSSGGHNKERLIVEPGLHTNIDETIKSFRMPNDPYVILTVHNYDPWDYVSNWWGHTTWGTEADLHYFDDLFKRLHDKFVANGLPVIIGEFGTLSSNERHSKWLYHDHFVRTAKKYGMVSVWWDNGEHLDRVRDKWNDAVVKDIIVNASKGIANSFVETGDLYIRQGQAENTELRLQLHGNRLTGIYNGSTPLGDDAYSLEGEKVTLRKSYLDAMLKGKELGEAGQLTFRFSEGADQIVYLHSYIDPVIEQKVIVLDRSNGEIYGDLGIPTEFNGTALAAVKAVETATGKPVHAQWTDREYVNLSDDFSSDAYRITLKSKFINMFDTDATVTFEFWPQGVQLEVQVKVKGAKPPAEKADKDERQGDDQE